MATRPSILRAVGAALVWSGGFAVLVFGILLVNYDPSLAGPGTEDPRPVAAVALPISTGVVVVGLILWRQGRRGAGRSDETLPQGVWRGAESEVLLSNLLSFDSLVIDKKLIELTAEYRLLDPTGNEVGAIRTEQQSGATLVSRLFSRARTLAVYDGSSRKVGELVCPGDSTAYIADGLGRRLGRVVEQNERMKRSRWALEFPKGGPMGSIKSKKWWHDRDLSIEDATGAEVGRITKKWAAHTYVLNMAREASPEMRLMMLASPVAIETFRSQALQAMG